MELLEALKTRRSIRKFKNQKVSDEDLLRIVDIAKYYCVYASRRDAYDYLYSKGDILGKYSNYICMSGRMSEALSGAMGNDFFIAKFETLDEVTAFKSMVLVKK